MNHTTDFDFIEPVKLADNLMFFYWGRHPKHDNIDMQLGGGAYVIFEGNEAIAIDSMNLPGHGRWVRNYMEKEYAISKFTLVNSHWHEDHIAENHVYADGPIIAHEDTRALMIKHRDSLQTGAHNGVPAFPVVLPTICFRNRLDIWCGSIKIELHQFAIHELGHIAAYLPDQKILIVSDMLEDPIWFFSFDVADADTQIAELQRMSGMQLDHIFPVHGDLDTIRNGGYDGSLIQHNADYLTQMMAKKDSSDFRQMKVEQFIQQALDIGELHWWEPYRQVHTVNIKTIEKLSIR
ncbi:MAG: hypothetical protein P1U57_07490 [Oleibacter sp.]|nr:hypothetical protein [Thalassolituus sp.]